jgi:hypothetical protein
MSAGAVVPGRFADVTVLECWYTWPDGRVEKKYMHKIDYEEAVAKEPLAWSLKPPEEAAPAKNLP